MSARLVAAVALSLAVAGTGLGRADTPTILPGKIQIAPKPQPATLGLRYLYINPCRGGCLIKKGGDDARTHFTDAPDDPPGTEYTLSEFKWGDDVWNQVMQCMREVYSPFDIEVTDQPPPAGTAYNEGIVAGGQAELHLSGFGGYAYLNPDCTPRSFALSFSFANDYPPDPYQICYVASQETAHSFGLLHSFEYLDGRSACNDPMSYRECGGFERFFRNEPARCGEFTSRPCGVCGATQNTHQHLLNILGPGTPITTPPVITVTSPADGATLPSSGNVVVANASAQRGIDTIDLILNGYKWASVQGTFVGPDEHGYSIPIPPEVPDGVIDVIVRAKDDIEVSTDAPQFTITKGAPCVSADTCAAGQRCEAGRCFWDPPVGQLGDECTFQQYCVSGQCQGIAGGEQRCTQTCVIGIADSCPDGFECLGDNGGVCWPSDAIASGCCSTSGDLGAQTGLLALGLGLLLGRRRRRRSS